MFSVISYYCFIFLNTIIEIYILDITVILA